MPGKVILQTMMVTYMFGRELPGQMLEKFVDPLVQLVLLAHKVLLELLVRLVQPVRPAPMVQLV